MPRLTKAVPKYRLHKPSGQALVVIAGEYFYLGPYGSEKSRDDYKRIIAEYLLGSRGKRSQPDVLVMEIVDKYLDHAKVYYVKRGKPTSEQACIKYVCRDLVQLYGTTLAIEFGPLGLKVIRQRWIDAGHTRGVINQNAKRIVRMFRWASSEELLPPAVYQALATVDGLRRGRSKARESGPVLPVELEVVERTMPCMTPVVADMVRCQLLAGMRPAEVCGLRPCDVDRTSDVWEYRPEDHKTEHHERERVVYIGPECQAILAPYLLRGAESHCFSPRESVEQWLAKRAEARVTPPGPGRNAPGTNRVKQPKRTPRTRYDSDTYRRAIHRACDAAFPPEKPLKGDKLKAWQSAQRWSPNRLRHTKATEIRRQFGLEAAQVILGHAAADVTQIYAERDAEKAREVARRIG